jgi:hypothetical protein
MLVCVFIVFSLRRESPDLILVDKPLISEVVLSHLVPNHRKALMIVWSALSSRPSNPMLIDV